MSQTKESMFDLLTSIDYIGTFVFAVSGILVGVEKKFDLFGVFILGFVTALGGGTLRDLLIGSTPVGWMTNLNYSALVLAALPFCYFGKSRIIKWKRSFFIFDTVGIGLFTILGVEKTLALGLSPVISLMMGVVSAVFGGVIRDVLAGKTPIIFHKEVYALACLCGGVVYLFLREYLPIMPATYMSIVTVIVIRILAIKNHWGLPFEPR